jgi:hypothetical protein
LQLNPPVSAASESTDQPDAARRELEGSEHAKHLARRLGSLIADAADADQWAIAVDGLEGLESSDFDDLLPRGWLIALNGGREAVYHLALPLGGGVDNLGVLQLGTIRPCGFHPEQVTRAQAVANWAADLLSQELRSSQAVA